MKKVVYILRCVEQHSTAKLTAVNFHEFDRLKIFFLKTELVHYLRYLWLQPFDFGVFLQVAVRD